MDWQLERIDPASRRGECVRLDADRPEMTVGRSERNDIVLYSRTASREHATLRRRDDGRWWLEPRPGKRVEADGEPTSLPVELCEGLSVQLGEDQLRFRIVSPESETVRPGRRRAVGSWLLVAAVVIGAGLAGALLWRG